MAKIKVLENDYISIINMVEAKSGEFAIIKSELGLNKYTRVGKKR